MDRAEARKVLIEEGACIKAPHWVPPAYIWFCKRTLTMRDNYNATISWADFAPPDNKYLLYTGPNLAKQQTFIIEYSGRFRGTEKITAKNQEEAEETFHKLSQYMPMSAHTKVDWELDEVTEEED